MLKRYFQLLLTLVLMLLLTSCKSSIEEEQETDKSPTTQHSEISLGGSTTLYAALIAISDQYTSEPEHADVIFQHSESSSGEGIAKVIEGELSIARASRSLTEIEISQGAITGNNIRQLQIGFDAVCVIVHPSKFETISSISLENLKKIFFDGTLTDWSQLDTRLSGPIEIFVRDRDGSGTANFFNRLVVGSPGIPYVSQAKHLSITTDIVPAVATNTNAISYAPVGFVDDSVRSLNLNTELSIPVHCNQKTIRERRYPLTRNMYLVTYTQPQAHITEFIEYVLDKKGQQLLSKNGIIPLR